MSVHFGFYISFYNSYIQFYAAIQSKMLINQQLTPFVTKQMPPTETKYVDEEMQADGSVKRTERHATAEEYLDLWALENGNESLLLEEKPNRVKQVRKYR